MELVSGTRYAAKILREQAASASEACPSYIADTIDNEARSPSAECDHENWYGNCVLGVPNSLDKRNDPGFYALWNPVVARALADTLDFTAGEMERHASNLAAGGVSPEGVHQTLEFAYQDILLIGRSIASTALDLNLRE